MIDVGLDWTRMEVLLAAASFVLALFSLALNYVVLGRQVKLQAEQVSTVLDAEKTRWLSEVLAAFGEASALVQARLGVYTDKEFTLRRLSLAHRFSALADQGRIYFPNFAQNSHGSHQPEAYRGVRRPVLDGIILAHDVVRCLDRMAGIEDLELLDILFDLRRVVVSEVQFSTDPRRRDAVLEQTRMMPRKRKSDAQADIEKLKGRVSELPIRKLSFTDPPTEYQMKS